MAIDEETKARFKKICDARKAIVEHLGGPWHRQNNKKGGSGCIDCPVCGNKESLFFSRAAYNGHIHAKCKTADCVAWMGSVDGVI